MFWIPIVAWIAAGVGAVVVLGFCAYEIIWKARRLREDLTHLQALAADAQSVQSRLAEAQQRLADTRHG